MDEQNHQVVQMRKIYNLASRAVVWIDSSESSSSKPYAHPVERIISQRDDLATTSGWK
jgi:hypothetical protein